MFLQLQNRYFTVNPVNAVLENVSSVHPVGNVQVYKKHTQQV